MKEKNFKKISWLNILLDIILVLLVGTFAWMITEASRGELTEYSGKFLIVDSNVEVKFYALIDGKYVEQGQDETDEILNLPIAEPGSIQRYRFDITNTKDIPAATKIVFSDITGDIELLKPYIQIDCNNPEIFSYSLDQMLKYDEEKEKYYLDFIDLLNIPPDNTESIYWSLSLNEEAPNDVQETKLSIGKIMFVYP